MLFSMKQKQKFKTAYNIYIYEIKFVQEKSLLLKLYQYYLELKYFGLITKIFLKYNKIFLLLI